MAIQIKNTYSGRTDNTDTNYPYGKGRNVVGGVEGTGTPFEAQWYNNLEGFLQGLLLEAGITPDGQVDNANSSQLVEAVKGIAREGLVGKIFQSPTGGGLAEIQTRTVDAGEVYEVRKTSDNSLATIYSDAAGTTEIVQNGTSNVSDSAGVVEFYITDGSYYVEAGGVRADFKTLAASNVRQAIEAVYKSQGYNNVFFFEDGFTYAESNDVGIYEDGTAWTYADAGALPVTIAAGTVPSEGVYKGVKVKASSVELSGGDSVQSFFDVSRREVSLADAVAEDAPVGYIYKIYGGNYKVVENSNSGGYYLATMPSGRKLSLEGSFVLESSHFGDSNDVNLFNAICEYASDGSIVKFTGEWDLNDSVLINSKNRLTLDFRGAVFNQLSKFKRTIELRDCLDCTVMGGNHNGYASGGDYSEWLNGSSNVTSNGVAAIYLLRSDGTHVKDIKTSNYAGAGIYWIDSDRLKLTKNEITGIGDAAIQADDNNQGFGIGGLSNDINRMDFTAEIKNNVIKGHSFGIFHNRCKKLQISGNEISDIAGQHGIYVIECSNLQVTSNIFDNVKRQCVKSQNENYVGRGVAPAGDIHTRNTQVNSNIATNCGSGIALLTAPIYLPNDQLFIGVTAMGNIFHGMSEDGMTLQRVTSALISGNEVLDAVRFGINCPTFSGKISNNLIKATGSSAIYGSIYESSYIEGNRMSDNGLSNLAGAGGDHVVYLQDLVDQPTTTPASAYVGFFDNSIRFELGDAASSSIAYLTSTRYEVDVYGTKTNSQKPFRTAGSGQLKGSGGNQFKSFFAGADNAPPSPIAGCGAVHLHGNQNPQGAGYLDFYKRGSICWNSNPSGTGQYIGWVCVSDGSPGAWNPFGQIA